MSDLPAPLICHVIYRLDYGGLENGLVNLVNNLPRDRYRHAIVCLAGNGALRARIERDDVDVLSIDKRPGKDPLSYARLWRTLRSLKPDIVHTRNIGTVDLQWVAFAAGVPHRIHGEHGWEASDPDGSHPRQLRIRRACRPVIQRWVAMSRDIAGWLERSVRVAPQAIRQLYNGVDTRRFAPGRSLPGDWPWNAPEPQFVFGAVGRLDRVKNFTGLLTAFRDVAAQNAASARRLRLVIVGDGPLRRELEAQVQALGLSSQVWLAGARADVAALMHAFDAFVQPSLTEGISNTVLEAMASGLPVIAARVGGNPEIIDDGVTGQLCRSPDPDELARAMSIYLGSPELAARHAAAGRARAVERFGLDAMMRRYEDLYDEALARPRVAASTLTA